MLLVDWACYRCILHLQKYSHRLNLFLLFSLKKSHVVCLKFSLSNYSLKYIYNFPENGGKIHGPAGWSLCNVKRPLAISCKSALPKAGRTRTDKIGVGAGTDIVGTVISCNFIARQYTGPTRQSYRDDHRHVGAMPATPSINRPAFSHLYARRGSVLQLSVPR